MAPGITGKTVDGEEQGRKRNRERGGKSKKEGRAAKEEANERGKIQKRENTERGFKEFLWPSLSAVFLCASAFSSVSYHPARRAHVHSIFTQLGNFRIRVHSREERKKISVLNLVINNGGIGETGSREKEKRGD